MSLCFLAKVAFKKVAVHNNGKSMNTHRKTQTEKHQHSKTAGFLNSTQANFHSKKLSFFLLVLDFYFILANTSSQFQGQKLHQLGTKGYIYIYIYGLRTNK